MGFAKAAINAVRRVTGREIAETVTTVGALNIMKKSASFSFSKLEQAYVAHVRLSWQWP